jgi:NAD(P)-dependent dehydrogenase (short-subunit alcohol dehydrogenase family)
VTVVLITGGGSGIGAAVADLASGRGDQVVVCGRRPGSIEAVARRTGGRAVVCDIGDDRQVAGLVDRVMDDFGRLDGLVLDAGLIVPGRVGDLSNEDWQAMVTTNLTGAFYVARAALPHLLVGGGSIVSVASVAALRASNAMAGYSAAKAGLVMLTQSLAVDYGPEGLRANVVCPGWTVTEMADQEMEVVAAERGLTTEAAYRLAASIVPQRRAATASEVAAAVVWLLSPQAAYVNGAVLPVDGGSVAVDAGTVPFDPRVTVDGLSGSDRADD